jgi:hypothetical protein
MTAYESWRVDIAWRSAPLASAPIWVDVTSDVDTAKAPIYIERGKKQNRGDIRPSTLSLTLRNVNQTYTPGNPTSTLYPHVKPGKRIRVVTVIGGIEYALFDGYLEFPEIASWKKANGSLDQHIALTAVDRIGRLDRSRQGLSTLTEHIVYTGGGALQIYYPLIERFGPVVRNRAPVSQPDLLATALTFGDTDPLPGDDMSYPTFITHFNDSGFTDVAPGINTDVATDKDLTNNLVFSGTQVLTVVAWVYLSSAAADGQIAWFIQNHAFGAGAASLSTQSGVWRLTVTFDDVNTSTLDGAAISTDRWVHIAARIRRSPDTQELWVDNRPAVTGSIGGSMPSSVTWQKIQIGLPWAGSLAHIQAYVSTATEDYSTAIHAAQRVVAFEGHTRQRVDDRVAMLAAYAGVASTDLELDTASALMARASLAGSRFGPPMREAAATDNGLLFTRGTGRIAFHGRQRRYNPPLAATVQLTWLAAPGLSLRTDQPINTQDVSATGVNPGYAVNADSVDEYGEYSGPSYRLDTVCDVDPDNLARFNTRLFAQPRQRAGMLAFELHLPTFTDAMKQTILAREISDMVALDGLPAYAPEGLQRFHIEGISHTISYQGHRVQWFPGAVVCTAPGLPDPFPRVGQARVRATTRIPF